MDTRAKMIDGAEACRLAEGGAVVVSGYFDPVVAWHAERLRDLKSEGVPLLVAIASPADPILPARARCELVASLRVVDYVTEADVAASVRLNDEDARCFEKLVEHVHARQEASS